MASLDVETQAHAGQAILILHGQLDMATESRLHEVAIAQLGISGLTTLGLDLADVTFLDSSGISALVDIRKQAKDRGIDMEILAVSQRVARVLTIVGLAEVFAMPEPNAVPAQSADTDP